MSRNPRTDLKIGHYTSERADRLRRRPLHKKEMPHCAAHLFEHLSTVPVPGIAIVVTCRYFYFVISLPYDYQTIQLTL